MNDFIALTTTPFLFIILGLILYKFPPRKINSFYGYRTSSSMKNQERWDFAQKYAAKEMIKGGGLLIVLSIPLILHHPDGYAVSLIPIGLLIGLTAFVIYRVEKAIKRL